MFAIPVRLSVVFALFVGLGFYGLTRWLVDDLRPRYLETMEETMVDTANLLAAWTSQQLAEDDRLPVDQLRRVFRRTGTRQIDAAIYDLHKRSLDMRVYVVDRSGTVVFDSDNGRDEGEDYSRWNDVILTFRGQYGARTTRADPRDRSSEVLYVAAPVVQDDEIVAVLTVCKPSRAIHGFLNNARRKVVLASLAAGGLVVLLGGLAAFWVTRPIRQLTRYADAIRCGKKPKTPRIHYNEIGRLTVSFEQMRQALEGKRYVERYVQSLTHEMKSPLSALQGAAELLDEDVPPERRRRFLDNIRGETERLRRLVDRMLELAAVESRETLQDPVTEDLSRVVAEVVESMRPRFDAHGVTLEVDCDDGATFTGEAFSIRHAVSNLLTNALEFTPEGGTVSVGVAADDGSVNMVVEDTGPGVPDYALERVFERFYSLKRPDTGRKSSGLGLTLVHEIAVLHGGEVTLENRDTGGARAHLVLPRG
ncbi:MAG: two-component system sensor histidine kinase CreC [Planctomycetota bacterium]